MGAGKLQCRDSRVSTTTLSVSQWDTDKVVFETPEEHTTPIPSICPPSEKSFGVAYYPAFSEAMSKSGAALTCGCGYMTMTGTGTAIFHAKLWLITVALGNSLVAGVEVIEGEGAVCGVGLQLINIEGCSLRVLGLWPESKDANSHICTTCGTPCR